jgi:hypothetical protein
MKRIILPLLIFTLFSSGAWSQGFSDVRLDNTGSVINPLVNFPTVGILKINGVNVTTGGGTPGGTNGQIQYNNSGAFGGFSGDAGAANNFLTGITSSGVTKAQPAFSNISGTLSLGQEVAGGSNTQVQYNSSGGLAGITGLTSDGTNVTGMSMANAAFLKWPDVGAARNAVGFLEVNNGVSGQWGSLKLGIRNATTAQPEAGLFIGHQSTGTPAAGFGSGIVFRADDSTTGDVNIGEQDLLWTTATHSSNVSDFVLKLQTGTLTMAEVFRVKGDGGFVLNGSTPASGKIPRSDGTDYKDSAFTVAAPGTSGNVLTSDGTNWTSAAASGGAPSNAHYVTTQAEGGLSAEFSLGSLTTGLLKHTVSGSVSTPATAVAKTDYWDTTDFVASGGSHAHGLVPDPGSSSGTTKFLREDATFAVPLNSPSITLHGDSDYTILPTDYVVATNAAFTSPRNWTLPAANSVTAGYAISVIDLNGGITLTNTLHIQRAGSDTIEPGGGTQYIFVSARQGVQFVSNGVSVWRATYWSPGTGTSNGQVMAWDNTNLNWRVYAPALSFIATTQTSGKFPQSDGTNVPYSSYKLPTSIGANNTILKSNGTDFVSSTETYAAPGTSGNVMTSDGTNWTSVARYRSFGFTADGAGSTVATGQSGYTVMKGAGTIVGWSIAAKGSSPTCTIDVWKIASGTALPTVSNTIMGTKPALATGNVLESTTMTGWTTSFSDGDIFGYNIDSVANATWIVFTLNATSP